MIPALDLQACLAASWYLTPDLWLRVAVLAGLMLVAGWVAAQRFFAGQHAFLGLQAAMVLWLLATLAERAAGTPDCKVTLALLAWPAIVATPLMWALFLHQYVHSDHRPLRRSQQLLLAVPVLLLGVASWSNGAHGLLYGSGTHPGEPVFGVVRMHYERGPLFWLQAAWSYALLLYCVALAGQAFLRAEGLQRRQWQGFLAMTLVPWACNIAYLGFGLRVFGADPTPLSFGAAVAGMAWLIGRNDLFAVVPLARRLLFSEMPDPVLIVDAAGRVMEANQAALALAPTLPGQGVPLAQWPRVGAALAGRLAAGPERSALLTLSEPTATYEVHVRDIGRGARRIGQLIQLRDVTAQQRTQARIVRTLTQRTAQLERVASLQEELKEQVYRDPLTGLRNRRALVARFTAELAHHRSTAQPVSLAVVDVDHFKQINDSLGHAAGDQVLRSLAKVMRKALRASDTVFRIGGEEFALLLPGADAGNALRRVEALRERVAVTDFDLGGRPVTVSAGIAAVGPGADDLDAMLKAADAALYAAKAAGRNRAMLAQASPSAGAPVADDA